MSAHNTLPTFGSGRFLAKLAPLEQSRILMLPCNLAVAGS